MLSIGGARIYLTCIWMFGNGNGWQIFEMEGKKLVQRGLAELRIFSPMLRYYLLLHIYLE